MKQRARQGGLVHGGLVKERVRGATDWQSTLSQGLALHQAGRLDEAAAAYRDVLRAAPHQPDALHLVGVVALQSGRLADAESSIRQAVAAAPSQSTFLI
jgi:Flp pilus assembly protein TadD